jgi:hypothetical protein
MIIGSTAIKHWFPDFNRDPKDLDSLTQEKISHQDNHWHDGFIEILKINSDEMYLDPDLLYTLKISHLSYPINWDKHMKDAIFLKSKGCVLNHDVYCILMDVWEDVHSKKFGSKKRITLNEQNDTFFKDTVKRQYDHDWLHEQFAFYDRPLHERIRKNIDSPLPSKELWDKLSHDDKLKCALEESYVIAFERFIDGNIPSSMAHIKAVKHLITNMTKGWFNLFLKENFKEIISYDKSRFSMLVKSING